MSGHSKWSTIKRKKGVADAKRGALFTKLAREVIVSAKQGGADPDMNFRLRIAIQRARDNNMPMDNIDRAIKKASGEGTEGTTYHEITYEGYGPGGVAIMVEALTDNRNRAISDVRKTFTHNDGNLGDPGCVAWIFTQRGVIAIQAPEGLADDFALAAIDAGAEDVKPDGEALEVLTTPETLQDVRQALESAGAAVESSEVLMVPNTTTALELRQAHQALRLLDQLEELDDVQKVYTNADFPDEALADVAS